METVDINDYYVSLGDQIKIYWENKRAHYNCQKPDFENTIPSPAVKSVNSHNDIKNDTHKWPTHTILIVSDSMFQNIDERRLSN